MQLIINSMRRIPSYEINSRTDGQIAPRHSWHSSVHYRVHKIRDWNLFRRLCSISLRSILLLTSSSIPRSPGGISSSGFLTEIFYVFLIFFNCTRNEKTGIAYPRAQIWKMRGIRRGFVRGSCHLYLGEEYAKHIQIKCSETKKTKGKFYMQ
jgi:hypothetical protein